MMVKVDMTSILGQEAAELLSEGDPAKAIEILEGDIEISHELREMIAAMLKGFGPNKTKLDIKGAGGEIKKTHRNQQRDLELYFAVEDEIEKSGCTITEACERLSGSHMVGSDTIRKAYQVYNKAYLETLED